MHIHRNHYINNQWQKGDGEIFCSINPATGEKLWEGHAATESNVDEAVAAGRLAFNRWSSSPLNERIDCLNRFKHELEKSSEKLADVISKEVGKPLWEAKTEVSGMIAKIGISIEAHADRARDLIKQMNSITSVTRHKPHGVVAVFGPYNFPCHLPNGHIIPALLAGNTIVFKPSELTPLSAEEMITIWDRSSLPEGVLNLVQGGKETGKALAMQEDLDGLFFTGSWQTGQILADHFVNHPDKILALELGGNNPLVVSSVNDTRTAAYLTIQSAFITSGQRCTCARRLIVPEGEKGDAFIDELYNMIRTIKVGTYSDVPEPFMGPVINKETANKLMQIQDDLKRKGGKPIVEMKQLHGDTAFLTPGLMDVTNVVNRSDEEYFGPFLQLIRVSTFDEAINESNSTSYGLSAGLLSDNPEEYQQFYQKVEAGIINWNTQLTGASSAAPFGGIGRSGNFRPSAYYAVDYCSYPVASLENNQMIMPKQATPGILVS